MSLSAKLLGLPMKRLNSSPAPAVTSFGGGGSRKGYVFRSHSKSTRDESVPPESALAAQHSLSGLTCPALMTCVG